MSKNNSSPIAILTKSYPNMDIVTADSFIINGELLCSVSFFVALYSVDRRQIPKWVKLGLKPHKFSLPKLLLFNPLDLVLWHKANIKSTSKASKFADTGKYDKDESELDLKDVSKDEADRRLQIQKVLIEGLKHKELQGQLVRADDLDKTLAEQAVMHKVCYMEDLETLPTLLQGMSKEEITDFLQDHYANRMENARELITKVYAEEDTLHEIVKKACLNG